MPSATRASENTPSSSGPRWRIAALIAATASVEPEPNTPHIPHMRLRSHPARAGFDPVATQVSLYLLHAAFLEAGMDLRFAAHMLEAVGQCVVRVEYRPGTQELRPELRIC